MPIAFLFPDSQTDTGANIATGALTDVDEGITAADAALEVSVDKQWATPFFVEFGLDDLPGDADSINSVIVRVRARIVGTFVDDSVQYVWTVQGTNVAHPTLQWDFETDAGAGLANRQQTVTDSPTVANINAALIRCTQVYNATMAKEAITHDWDCFELEVDYDTAGGNVSLTGDPGSLVLSGAVAGLMATFSVTGDPGTLVLTGAEADLNATFGGTLQADPGTLVLTGAEADLIADQSFVLVGDPGSLVFTGADAALAAGIVASPGSLLFTGAEADLIATGAAPQVVRRGGVRWLREPDPAVREEKTKELAALIKPAISAASTPEAPITALPSIISHVVSELPPGQQTRIDRLLQETGISLAELLKIIA